MPTVQYKTKRLWQDFLKTLEMPEGYKIEGPDYVGYTVKKDGVKVATIFADSPKIRLHNEAEKDTIYNLAGAAEIWAQEDDTRMKLSSIVIDIE